jgi:predicted peroxiredoxin
MPQKGNPMRPLVRLLVVLLLAVGLSAPVAAQDKQTLVVNITTDDVWTGQMALGFAKRILADGHDVIVWLNVRAVSLANRNVPQHTEALTGKTPHQMIAEFVEAGGRVFVCPSCTRQAGLKLDDRIDAVEPGSAEWRNLLMAPGVRVMSY